MVSGGFRTVFVFVFVFFGGARPLQTGGGGHTDREIKNARPWGRAARGLAIHLGFVIWAPRSAMLATHDV